jgi:predicted nuclease with TOPRIM domain
MKDQDILNQAPDDATITFFIPPNATPDFLAALKALVLSVKPRSLADIKELVQLRHENANLKSGSREHQIYYAMQTKLANRNKLNASLSSENDKLKSCYKSQEDSISLLQTQNQRLKVIITEREASIDDLESEMADLNELVISYQQDDQND